MVENTGKSFHMALVSALKKIKNPEFNKQVKYSGKSWSYADLLSIIDTSKQALLAEGIVTSFDHKLQEIKDQVFMVTQCILSHKDGEKSCSFPLPIKEGASEQDVATATTYGRRYSLTGVLALVADPDPDGSVSGHPIEDIEPKAAKRKSPPKNGGATNKHKAILDAGNATLKQIVPLVSADKFKLIAGGWEKSSAKAVASGNLSPFEKMRDNLSLRLVEYQEIDNMWSRFANVVTDADKSQFANDIINKTDKQRRDVYKHWINTLTQRTEAKNNDTVIEDNITELF